MNTGWKYQSWLLSSRLSYLKVRSDYEFKRCSLTSHWNVSCHKSSVKQAGFWLHELLNSFRWKTEVWLGLDFLLSCQTWSSQKWIFFILIIEWSFYGRCFDIYRLWYMPPSGCFLIKLTWEFLKVLHFDTLCIMYSQHVKVMSLRESWCVSGDNMSVALCQNLKEI